MVGIRTPHLDLYKPVFDEEGWDDELNTNFDTIDTQVHAAEVAIAGKAPAVHTHTGSQITDMDTLLATRALSTHAHAQADITGLVAALAARTAMKQYVAGTGTTFVSWTGNRSAGAGASTACFRYQLPESVALGSTVRVTATIYTTEQYGGAPNYLTMSAWGVLGLYYAADITVLPAGAQTINGRNLTATVSFDVTLTNTRCITVCIGGLSGQAAGSIAGGGVTAITVTGALSTLGSESETTFALP